MKQRQPTKGTSTGGRIALSGQRADTAETRDERWQDEYGYVGSSVRKATACRWPQYLPGVTARWTYGLQPERQTRAPRLPGSFLHES
jgi:hypothetical protein